MDEGSYSKFFSILDEKLQWFEKAEAGLSPKTKVVDNPKLNIYFDCIIPLNHIKPNVSIVRCTCPNKGVVVVVASISDSLDHQPVVLPISGSSQGTVEVKETQESEEGEER